MALRDDLEVVIPESVPLVIGRDRPNMDRVASLRRLMVLLQGRPPPYSSTESAVMAWLKIYETDSETVIAVPDEVRDFFDAHETIHNLRRERQGWRMRTDRDRVPAKTRFLETFETFE